MRWRLNLCCYGAANEGVADKHSINPRIMNRMQVMMTVEVRASLLGEIIAAIALNSNDGATPHDVIATDTPCFRVCS